MKSHHRLLILAAGLLAAGAAAYRNGRVAGGSEAAGPAPLVLSGEEAVRLRRSPEWSGDGHRSADVRRAGQAMPRGTATGVPLDAADEPAADGIAPASAAGEAAARRAAPWPVSPMVMEPVASGLPGGRLTVDGQVVRVEAVAAMPGQPGPALEIVDVPEADAEAVREARRLAARGGLSHEDELFRTRFGWAAWAAVQRAVRQETPSSE